MKFRCERDVLVEALGTAGRAAAGRGTSLPVLSGVRVQLTGDQLRLTGTDLELTISVEVNVSGSGDGVVILPGRLASDIVRALPAGSVEVEVTEDEARISAGRSEFSLRILPADEFPRLTEATGEPVTLASAELATALAQVVRAASSDDARPILTGVLLAAEAGGLRLVATDSYRLAIRDLPGTTVLAEGQHVLVPSRALQELARVLTGDDTLSVRLGEREASFEVGGTRLTTVLIEGEFPPYERLIPQAQPNRLTVGREVLLEAVRRVKLLAREATPVRLAMSNDGLELVAVTQDVGQAHESLDAKFEGTELTVAFNPEYLVQGIEVAPGDEITIETVDALKPALLRVPEHPEFLYLLMPVRGLVAGPSVAELVEGPTWRDEAKVEEYVGRVGRLAAGRAGEVELVEALPAEVGRVLDLGCGDGRLAALVLEAWPAATEAVGLDSSPPMLDLARARFQDDPRVEVRAHDLDDALPALGAFDVVVSGFAIHHLAHERKRSLFGEIVTVLRPGGVFANLEVVQCATPELHEEFNRRIDRPGGDPQDVLAEVEPQLEWMREAGLVQVDCSWRWRGFALLVGQAP